MLATKAGRHGVDDFDFSPARIRASVEEGDLIELGIRATAFGRTSLTMRAEVRNMLTRARILRIEKIVFVALGADGVPKPHGYTDITFNRDRLPESSA